MAMSVGPDGYFSVTVGWIATTFGTDIHGPHKMKPNDFGGV